MHVWSAVKPTIILVCWCAAGTGKTSSARLLSRRSALPLVYVPLEALVSKWYGESEQNMAKVRAARAAKRDESQTHARLRGRATFVLDKCWLVGHWLLVLQQPPFGKQASKQASGVGLSLLETCTPQCVASGAVFKC